MAKFQLSASGALCAYRSPPWSAWWSRRRRRRLPRAQTPPRRDAGSVWQRIRFANGSTNNRLPTTAFSLPQHPARFLTPIGTVINPVRQRLPNRRASEQFAFTCNDLNYVATVSYFPGTNRLAEILIGNAKAGSHSDSAAKDSAVVCLIALQFGVPVDVIRRALLRDARGVASSPLGVALDVLAGAAP